MFGLIDRRKRNRVEWSGVEWRGGGREWDHQTLAQTLITSHDESADCGGKLGAHLRAISTSDRADVRCCSAEYRSSPFSSSNTRSTNDPV